MKKNTGQFNFDLLIPMDQKLVIRTSAIKMYLRCPAQCLFRYIKGLMVPPGSALTFGTCFHCSTEFDFKYKVEKKRNRKLTEIQDKFNDEFKERKKKTKWEKGEKPDNLKNFGIKAVLPLYYKKRSLIIEPKLVEDSFKLQIPEANAEVTGQIDLVEMGGCIRDHKTASRTQAWDRPYKSVQGMVYPLGYKSKYGKLPKSFMLDYIIKTEVPKIESSKEVESTEVRCKQAYQLVKSVIMQIRMGQFPIHRENNYLCNKKFCGYFDICWKGAWMDVPKCVPEIFNQNTDEDSGGEE